MPGGNQLDCQDSHLFFGLRGWQGPTSSVQHGLLRWHNVNRNSGAEIYRSGTPCLGTPAFGGKFHNAGASTKSAIWKFDRGVAAKRGNSAPPVAGTEPKRRDPEPTKQQEPCLANADLRK